jgi:phenylalanyl-tRNA synthetase beta subunit
VLIRRKTTTHSADKLDLLRKCAVQVARTRLLPSALKTLASNKDCPIPIRLFEISDVLLLDASKDVGSRNERRLVAVQAAREAGFEILHGLLNRVMEVLGVALDVSLGGPADSGKLPRYDSRSGEAYVLQALQYFSIG